MCWVNSCPTLTVKPESSNNAESFSRDFDRGCANREVANCKIACRIGGRRCRFSTGVVGDSNRCSGTAAPLGSTTCPVMPVGSACPSGLACMGEPSTRPAKSTAKARIKAMLLENPRTSFQHTASSDSRELVRHSDNASLNQGRPENGRSISENVLSLKDKNDRYRTVTKKGQRRNRATRGYLAIYTAFSSICRLAFWNLPMG